MVFMIKTPRVALVPIWFAASVGGMIIASILFHVRIDSLEQDALSPEKNVTALSPNYDVGEVKGISTTVEAEDARKEIVTKFLERHDSPLTPYDYFGEYIVDIADKYQIDYRLLPAIAMQESNLCKKIPEGSYNCLGFGIHARGTLGFDSYEANFERAARELKANYIDIGLTTPEQIMTKYTPSSNGSWANSVNQWITEMEYDSRDKGREIDENADLTQYVNE